MGQLLWKTDLLKLCSFMEGNVQDIGGFGQARVTSQCNATPFNAKGRGVWGQGVEGNWSYRSNIAMQYISILCAVEVCLTMGWRDLVIWTFIPIDSTEDLIKRERVTFWLDYNVMMIGEHVVNLWCKEEICTSDRAEVDHWSAVDADWELPLPLLVLESREAYSVWNRLVHPWPQTGRACSTLNQQLHNVR